jgi:hypothetical protein
MEHIVKKDEIKDPLIRSLQYYKDQGYIIKDFEVEEVKSLWDGMSVSQQAWWYIANKLIPFIGEGARYKVHRRNLARGIIAKEKYLAENPHVNWYDISYSDLEYDTEEVPAYYRTDPKSIVNVSVHFTPEKAPSYIQFDFKLKQ